MSEQQNQLDELRRVIRELPDDEPLYYPIPEFFGTYDLKALEAELTRVEGGSRKINDCDLAKLPLKKVLSRHHAAAMKGSMGGAAMCICGQGCGGTAACGEYASLKSELTRMKNAQSEMFQAQQRMVDSCNDEIIRRGVEIARLTERVAVLEEMLKRFKPHLVQEGFTRMANEIEAVLKSKEAGEENE